MVRIAFFDHFVLFLCTTIFWMNSRGSSGVNSVMSVYRLACFVHQLLLDQGCEDIFRYPSFCPGTEPAVHALPWPEPLRQIPPWYSGVQPIQDCVEHFQVAFSGPASLCFFSGGNFSLILFHCCSLISGLFMCFILSSWHFAYNILVLKQTLDLVSENQGLYTLAPMVTKSI